MAFPANRTRRLFCLLTAGAMVLYVSILMAVPRHSNNINTFYAKRHFFQKGSNIPGMGPISLINVTTNTKHKLQDNQSSGHLFKETRPSNTIDHVNMAIVGPRNDVNLLELSHREQPKEGNETRSRYSDSRCSPKQNIFFLKVHKAGSTTVSNILQRYALRNDLNLVLPDKLVGESGFNTLGYRRSFSADMVIPVPEGQTFNILCNHVVYNRRVMNQLMPANTFYVAIVRSLEERFISSMNYFGQVALIMKETPGSTLEDVMPVFFRDQKVRKLNQEHVINSIAYDFGFPTLTVNEDYTMSYLNNIDKKFDFVMIMEYFDESLVLLRGRLCWDLRDILYIKRNVHHYISPPLTEKDRHKLYESQTLDHRIYQHFYSKFWDAILAEGRNIFDEVAHFRLVQKQVFDFCRKDRKLRNVLNISSSKWNDEFRLTASDCQQMMMGELMLVQKMMDRARERLRRKGTEKQWLKYVQKFWRRNRKRIVDFETLDEMFHRKKTNAT